MKLEKLLEQGLTKATNIKDWDNPVYIIDTNLAPKDTREFLRFVRESIDFIMDDVKSESVVNDRFKVRVSGELSKKYVTTAERLGRKAVSQYERVMEELSTIQSQPIQTGNRNFRNIVNMIVGGIVGESLGNESYGYIGGYFYDGICEAVGTRLVNQTKSAVGLNQTELSESSRNSLKSLINTAVGGLIGYSISPDYPLTGAAVGAFIGNTYTAIVKGIEYPLRALFNEVKRATFDEIRLNRKFPLAKKVEEFRRFGETIEQGYVRTRF